MSNRGRRGRGRGRYFQPYCYCRHPPAPVAPAPTPQPNQAGRDFQRAIAAVVLDKVEQEATVDRGVLRRELTYIMERRNEMRRILAASDASDASDDLAGVDVLHNFIKLALDEPMTVAGLLGAIKAPTVESQQLEAIKAQLDDISRNIIMRLNP